MSNLMQNLDVEQNLDSLKRYEFSATEKKLWKEIFTKQIDNLQDKAAPFFFDNCKRLKLSSDEIPNITDLNDILSTNTGWRVAPVSGLTEYDYYFHLLSNRIFPIAMHIRSTDEAHLSKDPDIFHEVFGHCTMLLSSDYADFMQEFAKLALTVCESDRPIIARLLWFTTETGLIETKEGLRIFGSSLLSSYAESIYSLTSNEPIIKSFDLIEVFREPYRADILQKVYFVLNNTEQCYSLLNQVNVIMEAISIAKELGEYSPRFPVTFDKYSNVGHCNSRK